MPRGYVPEKTVEFVSGNPPHEIRQTYRNLKEARFQVVNHTIGTKTNFAILLGTDPGLRGAPLQINYQPNWWFQITLNLKPESAEAARGQ